MTPTESGLDHGLYLQNAPSYLGDLATPSNLIDYAIAAEEAGWDGVFAADALGEPDQSFIDPWITLSAVASRTESVVLGSWITPLPRRQPWQLASELAALDEVSNGRVMFGVGLGAPWNYRSTGIEYDLPAIGDRYDEALEIITDLWAGETVTFHGEYYDLEELALATTPTQTPHIPIVMGFWWPNKKPIDRAASYDGIMPAAPSFWGSEGVQGEQATGSIEEEVEQMVDYYRNTAGGSGDIIMPIDVSEAPDDFIDICMDHGVTWTLTTNLLTDDSHQTNLDRIRAGPPTSG